MKWAWALMLFALCACRSEPAERELIVLAASSLRESFESVGRDFARAQQGVRVRFSFAGTQALRTQLEHGAPADVFASADEAHMNALLSAKRVQEPVLFARNEPVLVVHPAARLAAFEALPAATRIVLGAREVPIGRYTQQIFARAGGDFVARVEARVVSRELNVRQVLAKVVAGEADAGIVYASDAHSAKGKVRVLPIPETLNIVARYPIAQTTQAREPELAAAFIAHVLGPSGQAALQAAGFLTAR